MSPEVFNKEIQKLKDIWPNHYPESKMAVIWDIAKDMTDDWMKNTVRRLIMSCKMAPNPSDFADLAKSENTTAEPPVGSCGVCQDGMVTAWGRSNTQFVFKCSCEVGARRQENWPVWHQGRERDYKRDEVFDPKTSIFSDADRREFFKFARDVAAGKYTKDEVKTYVSMIERALSTKKAKTSLPYKDQDT